MWQLPITWVVTGSGSDRHHYVEPPADSFFDTIIEVDDLDEAEGADLLRRRALAAGPDDAAGLLLLDVADELARHVKPRTPRNLLAAAREIVLSEEGPEQGITNLYELERRAAELSRSAALLLTEVMDLGPVSASDRRLLERLGWTRARAAQVFKQLADAGLVVATDAASGAPGRPRRLFRSNSRFHTAGGPETPS